MKINEVEKLIGIPKATIRYYENESLLKPCRTDSGYRDYDENDINDLKKILVLRKAGIPVVTIREILNDQLSLQDAAQKSLDDLQSKMEELSGSISLCDEIANSDYTIDEMDADSMIDRIHIEESKGIRFLSIVNDLIDFEADKLGLYIWEKNDSVGKKFRSLVLFVLTVGLGCGVLWKLFKWGPFWENFQGAITSLLIAFVILGVVFFIGRINAKAGEIALKTVRIIATGIIAFALILLIVALLNNKLHFWF